MPGKQARETMKQHILDTNSFSFAPKLGTDQSSDFTEPNKTRVMGSKVVPGTPAGSWESVLAFFSLGGRKLNKYDVT